MNKKQEKTIKNYKEKLDEVKHELTLVKTKNAELSKLLEKCITSEKKSEEKIKALEKKILDLSETPKSKVVIADSSPPNK